MALTTAVKDALKSGRSYDPFFPDSNYDALFESACDTWLINYQIDYSYYLESKEHILLQKVAEYDELLQKYRCAYKEIAYLNIPDKTPIDVASYVNNRLVW